MPDPASPSSRRFWRLIAAAGICALGLAAAVAATGGVDWLAGPMRIRVHQPWRLAGPGLVLIGFALWLGGEESRVFLIRAWDARERHARWVAAAAAAAVIAVGLVKGTGVAGSADSYGYVSQAMLWLKGLPLQAEPLAAAAPWPFSAWSFSPLGYRPGVEAGVIVPTYPPGLPLVMAAFAGVGGAGAVYWVVPLLGALAVWLTYLIGRRYANATSGAAAALLLAASPVFLYQLVQPMSDVPVTAWWLLSLWGAAAGLPVVAGAGAAAAVLTRPNLAPLAAVILAGIVRSGSRARSRDVNRPPHAGAETGPVHAYSQHRRPGAALRAAGAFALPLAAAVGFLLWLNARLYGSPFMSGYGAASGLFALGNVPINAGRYPRWLLETQTPVVLIGLAAPFVHRVARRGVERQASSIPAWLGVAFVALTFGCYLPYSPFEEWWYLRFLLPAIPILLVLTAPFFVRIVSAAPGAVRAPLFVAAVGLLASYYVFTASERSAFDLRRLESRYVAAGAFASRELPASAVLLSVQESGPLRLYGGRTTVRFDHLDPGGLDAALPFLERAGLRPYFVLEAWEETQFRERFARSSPLGLLDWPPMAEVGRPVKVRFYDPRDRQRFLAGEPMPTARDPLDARRPR